MKKLVVVLFVLLGIFCVYELFTNTDLETPETETSMSITVQEVRSIGKLVTATFYRETGAFVKRDGERIDVFIIAKGKVNAGFDLMNMNENDIVCEGDTLYLTLPQPVIFNVIANPNDFEILADKKIEKMNFDAINKCKIQLKDSIKANAEKEGLLDKAKSKGEETLREFFKLFGFKEVVISYVGEVDKTPRLIDVESQNIDLI